MKRNRYRKALEILKSTEVDKKINSLDEALPTNHTKGVYTLNAPGFRLGEKDPSKVYYPDVDGNWPAGIPGTPGEYTYTRPEGYWSGGRDWDSQVSTDFSQDYLETDPTGRSTSTLIGDDGTVFSALPPGSENFILGPIVDGFVPNHTYDAYTNIGYIQKDTRQFVLLARISGQWKTGLNGSYSVWNGTSTGFTSYNQNFTLEMAQWVRDKVLADAYVSKVPYFYSGGVPQVPQSPADCPKCPPGMYGGNGIAPRNFGSGGDPSIGTEQPAPQSGDAADANLYGTYPKEYQIAGIEDLIKSGQLPYGLNRQQLYKIINYPNVDPKMQRDAQKMWIELMKQASDYERGVEVAQQWTDDPSTWPSIKNPTKTAPPIIDPKTGWPSVPNVPPSYRGTPSGQPVRLAHYKPKGILISEKLKTVKNIIKEQESAVPADPTSSPQSYQQQTSTGAGRVGSYAEGNKLVSWLQQQGTERPGGDGFISGYLGGIDQSDLSKVFLGTTINPETVKQMSGEIEKYDQESKELSLKYLQVWDEVSPQITAGIGRMQSAINAKDMGEFYSALADVNSLFSRSDAANNAAMQASSRYVNAMTQLGSYIKTGKFLPKDPFQLDDPTVARSQQEKKKRDDEVKKEIEKLNQQASDDQKAAQLNRLKALGMGALLAGVVALGIAVLANPAIVAAIGAATVRALKGLLGLGDDAVKGLSGSVDDLGQSGLGNVTGQVADDAASVINKLLKGSGGEVGGQGRTLANQIQRAVDGDDVELVKKLIKSSEKYLYNSYEPCGKVLSESSKKILREIKKPVVVPEAPKKYKMNFAGKYSPQNTPDKTASKISDDLVASGNARGQRWRVEDKYWQGYETTERMNIIYDRVGHGDQYWEEIINENKRKNAWKTKEMQEHLNILAHEKAMKEENPNYESPFYKQFIDEQETLNADKDPLFKKVATRLKKEIDYPDKPAKKGVPNEPPPEMINGYHPNYGKRKDYYKKLDPQSAEAMPLTGDAETDAQIKVARKKPK